MTDEKVLEGIGEYKFGFSDPDTYIFRARKGLDRGIVEEISAMKGEPQWMLDFRLKALDHFQKRPMPNWGGDLSTLNLDEIYYYVKPTEAEGKSG
jgi:Fe-S cluster assembly protein SufB